METVYLADIVRSDDMQPRTKTDPRVVERYRLAMSNGAEFPPIVVARLNGTMVLVDGFHRVAAMSARGIHQTDADIRDVASWAEAHWLAFQANMTHGVPFKKAELRGAFGAYMKANRYVDERGHLKSYRVMATELGGVVSYSCLRRWMKKDFPRVFRKLSNSEDQPRANGGLVPCASPQRMLTREAQRALDQAAAAIVGVTAPMSRAMLLHKAKSIVEALEGNPVEQPYC
jgi:hypothetical protein